MKFFFVESAGKLRLAGLLATLLCVLMMPVALRAQGEPGKTENHHEPESYASIRLVNMTQQREANDVLTDLRNMLPRARVYYVSAQNSITMLATAADLEMARKIAAELDQPRKAYRVTLTLAEVEGGKRIAARKYTLVLTANERGVLKQGQRIPIATSVETKGAAAQETQFQYTDVGLNLEASIEGTTLRTKVEQSASLAPESLHPSISQSVFESTSKVKLGVSSLLGTMDEPGTARHQEVEILVEPVE
jgi:type II secretory pathway component GspD/PulD (secretin)